MKELNKQQVRLIIVSVVFALCSVAVIAGIVMLMSPKTQVEGETYNIPITDSDRTAVTNLANNFVRVNSTWGVKDGSLNEENYFQVTLDEIYSIQDEETSHYVPRVSAYDRLRDNYVIAGSPLFYGDRNRELIIERSEYGIFGLSNISVDPVVADHGYRFEHNGNMLEAVKITVDFTNKFYLYHQTGDDVEWDGTVELSATNYDDSGEMIVVKDMDGEWKVYSFDGVRYPTVLASSVSPKVPSDINGSTEVVDKMKVNL